uniref:Uncharacterized protein n=1 Tax=Mus spicilegus TaxID=10103 RepID=A0A8C6IFC4_MUSSI
MPRADGCGLAGFARSDPTALACRALSGARAAGPRSPPCGKQLWRRKWLPELSGPNLRSSRGSLIFSLISLCRFGKSCGSPTSFTSSILCSHGGPHCVL